MLTEYLGKSLVAFNCLNKYSKFLNPNETFNSYSKWSLLRLQCIINIVNSPHHKNSFKKLEFINFKLNLCSPSGLKILK